MTRTRFFACSDLVVRCVAFGMMLAVFGFNPTHASGQIFSDDFETGKPCWVWSATVGGKSLCFNMPYGVSPPVEEDAVEALTEIPQADVVFAMDTTGSMGGEVANLQSSVASILADIQTRIPNSGFAVAGYDDYPYGAYGSMVDGDRAFYLLHRVMTASSAAGMASLMNAINFYQTHNGMDLPESGWEMVHQVATGAGSGGGAYAVPPFDPATAPPPTVPTGEEIGEIGGVGIREGSLPILVWITDAASHNSSATGNPYSSIPGVTPSTSSQALAAMNSIGGRIIGVLSGEAGRLDLALGVTQTLAVVTPDAWGLDGRPPGCTSGQCCTGLNGTGVPPVAGECPLLFDISSNGTGLGTAVVNGIDRLISSGRFDIGAKLVDEPSNAVDAIAAFVDRLEADATAPLPCAQGLVAIDVNPPDGVPDTFVDVQPGTTVCFNVVLNTNSTVPPTGVPQVLKANLEIIRDSVTIQETRGVFFRVPP